jgi:hypothetical protein
MTARSSLFAEPFARYPALRAALRDEPLPPEGLPSLARLLVFVDRVLVARACSPKDTINHLKTLSMRLNIGAFQRREILKPSWNYPDRLALARYGFNFPTCPHDSRSSRWHGFRLWPHVSRIDGD